MIERAEKCAIALALCCGLGCLPVGAQGVNEQAARPVLAIAEAEFHWGKAFRGEQLEHGFVIENQGQATLVVESLKPNCGCMTVKNQTDYKRRLEPGEKTTIVLHIDTRILEPGFVKNKHVEVITNAVADENRLQILGEIEELLKLFPPQPKLDFIKGGPPASPYSFRLEAAGERKVKIGRLLPRQNLLTASLRELEKERVFEATVTPTLKDLRTVFQSEDLETEVEVDGKPIPFRLQVAIRLLDRIEAKPQASVYIPRPLTAAARAPGAPKVSKTLEIVSLGGPEHKFKVVSVASMENVFAATVQTAEEGRRYTLTVTLEKFPTQGERFLKDTIEITTDDPEVPIVRIPATAQF